MEFIDIRKFVIEEKLKNPEGIAPVFKKEAGPGDFLQKIRKFIGEYSGVVISNHGFSTKSEYLVKVTKKTWSSR